MKKNNHGGTREGSGRPSLRHNKKKVLLTISRETLDVVDDYAGRLSLSRSDLIDAFMFRYLRSCKDIQPDADGKLRWTE